MLRFKHSWFEFKSNKSHDCMIRMIAWTMITWRRSHDSCSLVWVPYSGSNFNRHHASVLKFRVCTPCINTRLQHWTSVLKLFIYSIWKYYYITKYTVLKPLFFRPEASGWCVRKTGEALSFSSSSGSFRLLWSCKNRLVYKISFVWSLL